MDNMDFVSELSKLRQSSTFLALHSYRNEHSEVSDYSIIFNMSYENALKKSIDLLSKLDLQESLAKFARMELLESFTKSLTNVKEVPIEEREDAYIHFPECKGVKIHRESGALHLYGLIVHKRVMMPGIYPKVNSKALTIAKNKLRHLTPVGAFRQFRILPTQVDRITVEKLSLLPPE